MSVELAWLILDVIGKCLILLLGAILIYTLLVYFKHLVSLRKYPSGPIPIPVIGNLYKLGRKPYESFTHLSKVYGDVYSISMGMQRWVIINTIEAAREALITKSVEFAGRPNNHFIFKLVSRDFRNIGMADYGPHWKLNRKLGHSALRMYGDDAGKSGQKVIRECDALSSRLKKNIGEPINVHVEIGNVVANVICSTVFGERYEPDDPRFIKILDFVKLAVDGINPSSPVIFIPWIRHILPLPGFRRFLKALKIRDNILHEQLVRHRETFDPNNIRDLCDSLIQASEDPKIWEGVGITEVTDTHIEMIMNDLFVAGSHTTAGTLRWCVIYLLHWPQYQDLIYDEIVNAIGTDRHPTHSDRAKLPLLRATIHETLRLASLTPLGVPHKTTQDVTIQGDKHIPKDTIVMFNLWNIHHNEQNWKKPWEFDPRRWLDDEGQYVPGMHTSFLPFSAGRRVCLGESLAKVELFLILSRFMRDFKIHPNTDEGLPSLEGKPSMILLPNDYTVRLELRTPVIK